MDTTWILIWTHVPYLIILIFLLIGLVKFKKQLKKINNILR